MKKGFKISNTTEKNIWFRSFYISLCILIILFTKFFLCYVLNANWFTWSKETKPIELSITISLGTAIGVLILYNANFISRNKNKEWEVNISYLNEKIRELKFKKDLLKNKYRDIEELKKKREQVAKEWEDIENSGKIEGNFFDAELLDKELEAIDYEIKEIEKEIGEHFKFKIINKHIDNLIVKTYSELNKFIMDKDKKLDEEIIKDITLFFWEDICFIDELDKFNSESKVIIDDDHSFIGKDISGIKNIERFKFNISKFSNYIFKDLNFNDGYECFQKNVSFEDCTFENVTFPKKGFDESLMKFKECTFENVKFRTKISSQTKHNNEFKSCSFE